MQKRKILHCLHLGSIGGVETLFRNFLLNQKKPLFHHVLVSNKQIHANLKNDIETKVDSIGYVKYLFGIKVPRFFRFRLFLRERYLKKIKPDALIYWNDVPSKEQLIIDRKYAKKLIFYDHGWSWMLARISHKLPQNLDSTVYQSLSSKSQSLISNNASRIFENKSRQTLQQPFVKFCEKSGLDKKHKYFFNSIDKAVSCSHASKRILQLHCHYKGPIKVVLNRLMSLPSNILPKKLSFPIEIGVIARLVPLKAIGLAIHATKNLIEQGIDARLHIAGDGPEREKLQQLIKDLDLNDKIFLYGLVSDISSFYKKIHLTISPSIKESFSLSCLESIVHGCPVVCNSFDGLPEVVEDGKTGICIEPTMQLNEYAKIGGTIGQMPKVAYNPQKDIITKPKAVSPKNISDAIISLIQNYDKMHKNCIETSKTVSKFDDYVKELESELC